MTKWNMTKSVKITVWTITFRTSVVLLNIMGDGDLLINCTRDLLTGYQTEHRN